jgi:group I intron endonuclease
VPPKWGARLDVYGYVYLIRNKVNGNSYIGLTVRELRNRWSQHKSDSRKGSPFPLHAAIRKYGEDSFDITVLHHALKDQLAALEIEEIAKCRALLGNGCYNATVGGDGLGSGKDHPAYGKPWSEKQRQKLMEVRRLAPKREFTDAMRVAAFNRRGTYTDKQKAALLTRKSTKGTKASEETKASMRLAHSLLPSRKGIPVHTPESKEKIASGKRGKKMSPEARQAISAGHIGLVRSEEAKRKTAEAHRGTTRSPEARANMSAAWKLRGERLKADKEAAEHIALAERTTHE